MFDKDSDVSNHKHLPLSLLDLSLTFLKIGSTSFGGFMSLISVVENIFVKQRNLLTNEEMLDGISLATILPGPFGVNVVIYVGYLLRGGLGALVSGISILLPTFILILGLSVAYFQAGQMPSISKLFYGFIPAITVIILFAGWRMGKKVIVDWKTFSLAIWAGFVLKFVGGFYMTLIIVICAGILGYLFYYDIQKPVHSDLNALPMLEQKFSRLNLFIAFAVLLTLCLLYVIPIPFLAKDSLARLFITFSGMSLLLFGGGYIFIPLIQEVVVNGYGWITQMDFVNGIALGQITPGPILITSAFIGYAVKGFAGAIVATIGMFFPPGLLMITCSHLLNQVKKSVIIQSALKGIRPAIVGMIFTAAIAFAQTAPIHWATLVIFTIIFLIMYRWRVDVILIIPIAGILGLCLYSL